MKVILVRSRAINPNVNKAAAALSQNGYDVTLLVWDRQHTLKNTTDNNYKIARFTLKAPYDRYSALLFLPFWWIFVFYFLIKNKCDVIHACDLDTLYPAILAKVLKRVKLCYTIYDFYANNLPDGKFQLVRNLIRKIVASVERFGIGFTEALFLVDECRYENVKGARIKQIAYIYNSPPDSYKNFEARKSNGDVFNIVYIGILHESRGLKYLINAVTGLDNVKLIIGGIGPELDLVEKAAKANHNICYIGQIPYQEVIKNTLESDLVFAMYDPRVPTNKLASPNKLFEAMMCGKPILINDGIAAANIVKKENCGVVVSYGSVNEIRDTINKLQKNPRISSQLSHNGRKAYEERYGWETMKKRLLAAYTNINNKKTKKNAN